MVALENNQYTEKLLKDKNASEEDLAAMEIQIQELKNQIDNLANQITDLETERVEKQNAADQLQADIDAYEDLLHNVKVAEEELLEAQKRLEELEDLLFDMKIAEDNAETLRNNADQMQAEADREQAEANALKNAADEAQDKLTELERLPDRIADIEDQLANPVLTEQQRSELAQQKVELEQLQTNLQNQKDQLEKDIEAYEKAYEEYVEAQKKADEADRIADNAEAKMDHLDQTNDLAASEQIEADEHQKDADEAKAEAIAKQEYADSLKPGAEAAEKQIPETEKELETVESQIQKLRDQLADPDLTQKEYDNLMIRLEKLKDRREDLKEELKDHQQTIADAEQAQEDADEAKKKAESYQTLADPEQENAEAFKQEDVPIYAGGNLTITTKGDIGTDDPLDITAGVEADVKAEDGNVHISNSAHMNLGDVSGESVELNTSGDIKPIDSSSGIHTGIKDDPDTEEDESKTETSAQINALGSSAGSADQPLNVDADRISGTSGDDVSIWTPGDVTVDQLTAGGNLTLDVNGDILAGDAEEGAANVTGGSLDLNANGNIGSKDNWLVGDLRPQEGNNNGLLADAVDIYLKLLGDVVIRDVNGEDVFIDSDGRIDGAPDNGLNPDIEADNLYLQGANGVGSKDNLLIIRVPGRVEILSKYGDVWFRNIFSVEDCARRLRWCCCMCRFWDMVVERIMTAEEGETVEILETVPCSRMPDKVMEALRQRDDVTLILHLKEEKLLVIEAGTALDYVPGIECYSLEWLVKHYMGEET